MLPGLRHMVESKQDKSGEGQEIATGQVTNPEQVGYLGDRHRGVDQERAIFMSCHFGLGLNIEVGEVAGNCFQQIGSCDNSLHDTVFIDDDGRVRRRLLK
jgi:hypothetical protein